MDIDVAIVGSGMAGLYTAVELLRAHPTLSVSVFEKYKTLGGRTNTFRRGNLQWEAGAGRISNKHRILMGLLKRYKLKWIPIGGAIQYKDSYQSEFEPNLFEPGIPTFLDPLASLPAADLARHTVRELLTRIHGAAATEKYLIRFPYRAEVDILRADEALRVFQAEMRAHVGYGICAEGLSTLVDRMRCDIEGRGGAVRQEHELAALGAAPDRAGSVELTFAAGPLSEGNRRDEVKVTAKHVVLAIPSPAAAKIPGVAWRGFRHLRMIPLLRFYGVFPSFWPKKYGDGARLVTATPIRYMIPGSAATGSVQISYTDNEDAKYWMRRLDEKGEEKVGTEIMGELRRLLDPDIPSPTFVKAHAWSEGTTYWLPGAYSPKELSAEAATGIGLGSHSGHSGHVHLCGESYSLRQGWIEGALEHAELLLKSLNRSLRRNK